MSLAQEERAALVATLREVGPDAPTLCAGWDARDLAAHLVVRERRLDAAPGIMIKPLAGYTDRVQKSVSGGTDFDILLGQIADGPPLYSPMKLVDRWANLAEMFIHHEDVLRGGVDPDSDWQPRVLSSALEKSLTTQVRSMARMTLRSAPARVHLRTPDGTEVAGGGAGPEVTVTGRIGELLLFMTGRSPAVVTFDGDPDAIAAVRGTLHGF
ncbi:TIGR03085 family metal-binding protein [Gordonia sp. NPDC003376]